jgi:hypothetical protein
MQRVAVLRIEPAGTLDLLHLLAGRHGKTERLFHQFAFGRTRERRSSHTTPSGISPSGATTKAELQAQESPQVGAPWQAQSRTPRHRLSDGSRVRLWPPCEESVGSVGKRPNPLSRRVRRAVNQSRKVNGLHRVVNAAAVLVIMPAHMLASDRSGNGRDSDLTVPRAERGKVFGAVTRSL